MSRFVFTVLFAEKMGGCSCIRRVTPLKHRHQAQTLTLAPVMTFGIRV